MKPLQQRESSKNQLLESSKNQALKSGKSLAGTASCSDTLFYFASSEREVFLNEKRRSLEIFGR